MSARMFGTDGVRGVANDDLTCALAFGLGKAAVRFLGERIVVGKDTRRSGDMLEAALASGIMSAGGQAHLAGVLPTPGVAMLARTDGYDGGVVISASHNPPQYNGIKFFDGEGFKLPDATEDAMQAHIESECSDGPGGPLTGSSLGTLTRIPDAAERYIERSVAPLTSQGIDLRGMRIVVDCGHGASCVSTPEALARLGADVVALNDGYTGDDINVGCGSTDLTQTIEAVLAHGADLGLAHDGDADRLQAVDSEGKPVDGDQIEAICAVAMKAQGKLAHDTAVTTVMCNLGFKKAMAAHGIRVETTAVGDRYVLERMREGGFSLGGEQSGHMIFLDRNTTGDGLATALNLLAAMRRSGKPLSELSRVMEKYPQVLVNVRVSDKDAALTDAGVVSEIEECRAELADEGSILVRASGTEPLVRVMVEAADDDVAGRIASRIAQAVQASA